MSSVNRQLRFATFRNLRFPFSREVFNAPHTASRGRVEPAGLRLLRTEVEMLPTTTNRTR